MEFTRQLARGSLIREFMKQAPVQPYSVVQQVALIYTATRTSVLDGVNDNALLSAFGDRSSWATVNATSLTAIDYLSLASSVLSEHLVRLMDIRPARC